MNNKKLKLMVFGNCTAYSIADALRSSGFFEPVSLALVFSMTGAEREVIASNISTYDIVVSLEHAAWAGPLATDALRRDPGKKLITLPTPFFSGLFPDKAYLKYKGAISRSQAVLGDYHSALILEEVKSGIATEKIVKRYVSGESFGRLNVEEIWNESLAELKNRESQTDIGLSDFIEQTIDNGTIAAQFLSFNHPAEGLIDHIARKIVHRTTGKWVNKPLMTRERHGLNAGVKWPLHPAVAARLSLPQPNETRFRRPPALGGGWIEMDEFARQSIAFFTQDKNPSDFEITTPYYLQKHIYPVDRP
ncbi:MAG: WcbI family polysaccharide biosynthesis putative acetyltransferase [Lentimicrobiaceae bacterium]|nr:WcbI family polysaccharide biosynthesis putative acetyltransferase [Lentimicrobiaceae bacterium]